MPSFLPDTFGGIAGTVAPHARAGFRIELHDVAHGREQQRERMIGHAIVVGAGARDHGHATRLRMGDIDVLVAGAERADERELRKTIDLGGGGVLPLVSTARIVPPCSAIARSRSSDVGA